MIYTGMMTLRMTAMLSVVVLGLGVASLQAEDQKGPIDLTGQPMPAWSLPSSTGGTMSTQDLAGTTYVLYFYPKNDTPGCTTQACDFRDNMARLQSAKVKVFGVSADSLESHAAFIDKFQLPFPLLTDADQALMKQLGVWAKKKRKGKESMGISRSTFLVNGEGVVVREWRQVNVKGHVDEVLAVIGDM